MGSYSAVTKKHEKRKQLKAVGLDFEIEPELAELRRLQHEIRNYGL